MCNLIYFYKDNKTIKLSDGTMSMSFDEFRRYANASDSDNINDLIIKVNSEDRVEFLPMVIREAARNLRERS